MDEKLRDEILRANLDFYQTQATDFSRTRQHAWPGWQELPLAQVDSILDVAGGNGRLYQYARERGFTGEYFDIDASAALLRAGDLSPQQRCRMDILGSYQAGEDWKMSLHPRKFALVACFGFFHHVPGFDWRERLLTDLWALVAPNGYLAVSFWRFRADRPQLIREELGDHDYWLSWGGSESRRFAHECTDQEIDSLAARVEKLGALCVSDYLADGKTGRMNRYLIWQKTE